MKKTEIWAVELGRIALFFQSLPDSVRSEAGFVCGNCRITVTALGGRELAGMRLPRTQVVFEGEEAAVNAIYRQFHLRFLSAGG